MNTEYRFVLIYVEFIIIIDSIAPIVTFFSLKPFAGNTVVSLRLIYPTIYPLRSTLKRSSYTMFYTKQERTISVLFKFSF